MVGRALCPACEEPDLVAIPTRPPRLLIVTTGDQQQPLTLQTDQRQYPTLPILVTCEACGWVAEPGTQPAATVLQTLTEPPHNTE